MLDAQPVFEALGYDHRLGGEGEANSTTLIAAEGALRFIDTGLTLPVERQIDTQDRDAVPVDVLDASHQRREIDIGVIGRC